LVGLNFLGAEWGIGSDGGKMIGEMPKLAHRKVELPTVRNRPCTEVLKLGNNGRDLAGALLLGHPLHHIEVRPENVGLKSLRGHRPKKLWTLKFSELKTDKPIPFVKQRLIGRGR
jgi:hypothetical protein